MLSWNSPEFLPSGGIVVEGDSRAEPSRGIDATEIRTPKNPGAYAAGLA